MGSKAWIVILGFGLVGLCSMGLMTKFAVDSSPQLKKVVQLKAALASELKPRGVEAVSVRRIPRGGFQLKLVCEPGTGGDDLDVAAARSFAKGFPEAQGESLEVLRVRPPTFGCSGDTAWKESRFQLETLRIDAAEEERRERIGRELSSQLGVKLIRRVKEDRALRVEIEGPAGTEEDMRGLARRTEPIVRGGEFPPAYTVLIIAVRPGPEAAPKPPAGAPAAAAAVEVRFDPRGREIGAGERPGRPNGPAGRGRKP